MELKRPEIFVFDLKGIELTDFPAGALGILPKDELDYCSSPRVEKDRMVLFASRVLRRRLISRYSGVPESALGFDGSSSGKPTLVFPRAPGCSVADFNVSHSGHLLAFVFSPAGNCGIDIEAREKTLDPEDLMHRPIFSLREIEFVKGAADRAASQLRFYLIWTLKEAVLKASGDGLRGIEQLDLLDLVELEVTDETLSGISRDGYQQFCVDMNAQYLLSGVFSSSLPEHQFRYLSPTESFGLISGF
jgi:phosphopantetheinyl transferase